MWAAGSPYPPAGAPTPPPGGGRAPPLAPHPTVVAAMREVGIDISGRAPRPLTDEAVGVSDVVVTMGCGDACPFFPGISYRDWVLPDPCGESIEVVRTIRDRIRILVENLIGELVPAHTP
ncbi:heat-shock protein HtpX [Nocardia farcinica]|uniref:arsenate reductase/protein-tyrosine-phosphatase family protein n=1 Tax=Nocardia farcinica TaxID=37329 RepID=UPI00245820BF|nr:heat-shock protein HtpX [Nocardia farcinica]